VTEYLGLWMFPVLVLFLLTGFPIAFSLMAVALIFGWMRFEGRLIHMLVSKVDDVASNYILGAVPLFVFMGAMLARSGIAERLFDAIQLWMRNVPGGLAISAVLMCTIFAAASGIAGATETVVGMLAIPAMLKNAYDKRLISGAVCGGGSLGTVIPPSITVIVLAPAANLSVGDLFAGILLPGLIMAGLFLVYILLVTAWNPRLAPPMQGTVAVPWGRLIWVTVSALVPPALLIFAALGTILLGWATPTEGAACGALGTLLLAAAYGRLSWPVLTSSLMRTLSVTAMILTILLGGAMFAGVFVAAGGLSATQSLLTDFGLAGWPTVALILLVVFLAGFILDLISVILIIIPIAMPIVIGFGFDPLWFAIAFLVVLQTSYLTPPMAPAIFYLRAIAPPEITLRHMYVGVLPFIALQLVTLAIVILFPAVATWLPGQLRGFG
jgi:tripartite ATP-independent transporter DctM subunit